MRFLLIFFLFFNFSLYSKNLYFNNIEIHGLKNVSKNLILSSIEHKKNVNGSAFFDKLISLNCFDYLKVQSQKNKLDIFVKEKPLIRSIKFYGDKPNSYIDSIFTDLKFLSGNFYDNTILNLLKSKLENYYSSIGFYNIDFDFNISINDELNIVDIDISISKNNYIRIKNITISGNYAYNNNKILSNFSSSSSNWMSWFTKSDIFFKGKIISDLKKIKSFYFNNGYIDFYINFVKIYLSNKLNEVYIHIDLFEGDKHNFSNVYLECTSCSENIKFYLLNLLKKNIINGKTFNFSDLLKVRKDIVDFFNDNGFINTSVDFNTSNLENDFVNIVFIINVSRRIMVRKIDFIGNYITSDHVLRSFIPQNEESWVSLDNVNFGKQEILRHGLASNVDIIFSSSDYYKDSIDITYKIKEYGSNKLIAGFSYFQGDNFIFNISSEMSNFFGTGSDLGFSFSKSKSHSDYNFSYLISKFLNSNYDLIYNFYYKTEKFNRDFFHFDHVSDALGGSISYQINFGKYKKLSLGIGYDKTRLKLIEDRSPFEIKDFLNKEGLNYKEYFFSINYFYNSLDRPMFPKNGKIKHFQFRFSFPISSLKYYYFNYDFTLYNSIKNFVFSIYYNLSYGNSYFGTQSYPFFKNFSFKGQNNIRGFKERSLGPKDSNGDSLGGNLLFCMKFSIYLPIPYFSEFESVRTSMFLDIGQVYDTENFSNKSKYNLRSRYLKYNSFFRFSIGFDITWNTPFGMPVDFSLAYPLNSDFLDKKKFISFSFGI